MNTWNKLEQTIIFIWFSQTLHFPFERFIYPPSKLNETIIILFIVLWAYDSDVLLLIKNMFDVRLSN